MAERGVSSMSENEDTIMATIQPTNTQSRKRKLGRKWTTEEVRSLVSAMESRESLWNSYSTEYKNRDVRSRCWSEISNTTQHSIEDCKLQWNAIKTRYNTEMRKTKASSSGQSGETYVSKWEHFSGMKFLLPTRGRSPGESTVTNLVLGEISFDEAVEFQDSPRSSASMTVPKAANSCSQSAVYDTLHNYLQKKTSEEDEPQHRWKRSYLDYVYDEMCLMPEQDARRIQKAVDDALNRYRQGE